MSSRDVLTQGQNVQEKTARMDDSGTNYYGIENHTGIPGDINLLQQYTLYSIQVL